MVLYTQKMGILHHGGDVLNAISSPRWIQSWRTHLITESQVVYSRGSNSLTRDLELHRCDMMWLMNASHSNPFYLK